MDEVIAKLGTYKIVPVVVIEKIEDAIPLGQAIVNGDLPIIEITLRTSIGIRVIKVLTEVFPELLIGAGSVLTIEQVKQVQDAGAKFIVTPGFNPKVVDYCLENTIPITPGISSPSLIEMALERNLEVVKFFPAEALGGLNFLKAISAPYPNIKFIPTGGINQHNLTDYLKFNRVHACGGSWLVDKKLIADGKFAGITKLVKEACDIANSASV